jgi:hypothetical protein
LTTASSSQPVFDAIDAGHWEFTGSDVDVKRGVITRAQIGKVLCRRCIEAMPCEVLRVARAACRPMAPPVGSRIYTTPSLRLQ